MKNMNRFWPALAAALALNTAAAQRTEHLLRQGWKFTKGTGSATTVWQNVSVPHDWAIYGPFDESNDLQRVAIEQNGEKRKSLKTGRTGGLPFIGKGEYRTTFEVADTAGKNITLLFDGAMSNARVQVNGREVAYWPYGYNSFHVDITDAARPGSNELQVNLENYDQASRWYPGAGLYRNVHLIVTDRVHIPVWGTYLTTPVVSDTCASVRLEMRIAGTVKGQKVTVSTTLKDADGQAVAGNTSVYTAHGQAFVQNFTIDNPKLWSPDTPYLYTAHTTLSVDGREVDGYDTRFGVRRLEFIPERGFLLNGRPTKLRGVCNHHDLGPLGAAVNRSALRHQLEMLKEMGANAIRTSHNMPAPELVELCDEMGLMMMVEPFDDWGYKPKTPNGYGRFFKEWAERDVTNMVEHFRNSPSVVLWSIGNEITSQGSPDGIAELNMLQDIVHRLDPTRPVTCGLNKVALIMENGFGAALDLPGLNYKPNLYEEAYAKLPQRIIVGSETASTVSSRGKYHFPVQLKATAKHPDRQSSSYDTEYCNWSNTPDEDFAVNDDHPWVIGQFVWTGFDYLGEPTPYDTNDWPNHSSVFGIIDLASQPKDRYWLYRSQWRTDDATLHILPHWNWAGREGEVTPVFVYTSWPKAELFVNGKSQGMRWKNDSTTLHRYRLMWNDVRYEPGEVKVVAYDADGRKAGEQTVRTAGAPHHLVATPHRTEAAAGCDEMIYITVQVADKQGNIVPTDERMVRFEVTGAGEFAATANGDPTCLLPFQKPEMLLFSGAATAIVRAGDTPGVLRFKVTARGLKAATAEVQVK